MYSINKQKFLAELGRLLTFMYEEDRQTALSMYNRLFDTTDDEQALLQFLVSPTRQAVVLARKYDAAERKLHVRSQHRDPAQAESSDTPPFVLAIEKLEQEALSLGITAPVVDADQLSLFEDEPSVTQEDEAGLFPLGSADAAPADPSAEPDTLFSPGGVSDAPVPSPAQAESAPAEAAAEELPAQPLPAEDAAEAELPAPSAAEDGPAPAEGVENDTPAESEARSSEGSAGEQSAPVDKVDAFLSDFSIKDDISSPGAAAPSPAAVPAVSNQSADAAVDVPKLETELPSAPAETVRKARVPLLILYSIAAVIVGLVGTAVLLIPALLSLSFAALTGWAAFALMGSAFSSFAMFADILAVLGVALILFALALLFAWLFFWLIGGAICGLIRGLCRLGGKCCFKEVPAV